MPAGHRHRLLDWAAAGGRYIIEDDYDSELRYFGRPIASLQGMDRGDHVIYMGTPSKVLPPSIRLSYMVLPDRLRQRYDERSRQYRQGASVMEQLVWAEYIRTGEWSRQIRRLRKHYNEKSKYMVKLIQEYMKPGVEAFEPEGGVYVEVRLPAPLAAEQLVEAARAAGCAVKAPAEEGQVLLSFSAIPTKELREAVETLARAWKGFYYGHTV